MTPQTGTPIRVAQICTDFGTGGIARHALDLSAWLKERGHRVFLAGTEAEWANRDTDDDFLSIPVRWAGGEGGSIPARLINAAQAAAGLRRWIKSHDIELIHAHESAPGLVSLIGRLGLGVPLIITYHGSHPDRVRGFGAIARHADRVVTPSYRAAEALAAEGGVPSEKIEVIGLGVRPAPVPDPDKVHALRASLLGEHGTHLIASLSRLSHQKGIDILIDTTARLIADFPGLRVAIVGDGPLAGDMRDYARERGVADHVIFSGRTDAPYTYLHAADLMLLTSRWEALPISIVEAFQTGTPVVATDCSGVHQLVDDSVGACVPVGDTAAISAAVARILADDELRARMGATARQRSTEDRFDPAHINGLFEKLYFDTLGRAGL